QRQRHLCVRLKRGMTAREYEAQPVILDALVVRRRAPVGDGFDLFGDLVVRIESRASPYGIDRLEATRRNEPRPRVRGHARARPLFERCTEGIMQCLFREIEV